MFLPGESQGWRSLVGCCLWVAQSQTRLSDWTELNFGDGGAIDDFVSQLSELSAHLLYNLHNKKTLNPFLKNHHWYIWVFFECPHLFSSYHWMQWNLFFSSVSQSCPTLCDPINCSTPGLPVHHQLPESIQTHVHWVGDAIQPDHPLSSPSSPALNLSQHQGLFKWVSALHQVAKVLEFHLEHHSFQWTPRTDHL